MTPAPIVVVGDVLLDQDIDGDATRLAPDAPVPVVDVSRERSRPGGAGLAAALAARGGRTVLLVTALGTDPASEALLRRLRPDVWVKGGDYSTRDLPEAATLREWGGQALVLPYLNGRSTTELARRAAGAR